MKLLAVDDDESIRDLLPMILEDVGITDVTVASSAQNALRVISETPTPFECFLLDIQMPGGDGIDLCDTIRKLPAHQKTPIIMLTAMHDKSFIDDAFAVGATDYVTKPFDIPEFHSRVRMSKLLSDEQRKVQDLLHKSGAAEDTHDDRRETGFDDAFDIGRVKGLVAKPAFENYLAQLSRSGAQATAFFCIHVLDCKAIFDRGSSSELSYVLEHVADAVGAVQALGSVILCYLGGGNFICSSTAARLDWPERLEADIQGILDEKNLSYDDGALLDIEIAVGAVIQPLMGDPLSLEILEPQAVKRAMVRVEKKLSAPAIPNIRRVSSFQI